MADYDVPVVPRGREALWHKRWPLSGQPSTDALAADQDGSLSQTVFVTAKNPAEAAAEAERLRPGCVAIRDAIRRLG